MTPKHKVAIRQALPVLGGVLVGAAAGAVAGCLIAAGVIIIIHALWRPTP